jgi:hypothetical protein
MTENKLLSRNVEVAVGGVNRLSAPLATATHLASNSPDHAALASRFGVSQGSTTPSGLPGDVDPEQVLTKKLSLLGVRPSCSAEQARKGIVDFSFPPPVDRLRAELRAWLAANLTEEIIADARRAPGEPHAFETVRGWNRTLADVGWADVGWAAVAWPRSTADAERPRSNTRRSASRSTAPPRSACSTSTGSSPPRGDADAGGHRRRTAPGASVPVQYRRRQEPTKEQTR